MVEIKKVEEEKQKDDNFKNENKPYEIHSYPLTWKSICVSFFTGLFLFLL